MTATVILAGLPVALLAACALFLPLRAAIVARKHGRSPSRLMLHAFDDDRRTAEYALRPSTLTGGADGWWWLLCDACPWPNPRDPLWIPADGTDYTYTPYDEWDIWSPLRVHLRLNNADHDRLAAPIAHDPGPVLVTDQFTGAGWWIRRFERGGVRRYAAHPADYEPIEDPEEVRARNLLAYQLESRVAMSIIRPNDFAVVAGVNPA